MNELYEKALKANVARTEIAGDVNTKWTPDAIKIIKEKEEVDAFTVRRFNEAVPVKKRNWWRVAFFIAIGLSILENFLK